MTAAASCLTILGIIAGDSTASTIIVVGPRVYACRLTFDDTALPYTARTRPLDYIALTPGSRPLTDA